MLSFKKIVTTVPFVLCGLSVIYAADDNQTNICPSIKSEGYKTINMKDMSFKYMKYEDHICAQLRVKLNRNPDWRENGSGWFAAGFGAKTMKGSNMFIFVPEKSKADQTTYQVHSNVGGAYGPTKALDTMASQSQLKIISQSLGKVDFAFYPSKVEGLSSNSSKIDMIFSHSKGGVDGFVPPHVKAYDGKSMQL